MVLLLEIAERDGFMIKVSQLGASDSPSYRAIRLESLRLHPDCFAANYDEERLKRVLFFEAQLQSSSDSGKAVFGAFYHDELIGICAVAFISEGQAELLQVYVRDKFRGHGVMNQLICLVKEYVKAKDGKLLMLRVHQLNQTAIRGYRRAGFSVPVTDGSGSGNLLSMYMRLSC